MVGVGEPEEIVGAGLLCRRDHAVRHGPSGGGGDGPGPVDVVESEGGQPLEVDRSDAVVQPVIVLEGSAVAQFSVAAHDPGDAAFNNPATLPPDAVFWFWVFAMVFSSRHVRV